jgi:ketosteroid isomerase-like protein
MSQENVELVRRSFEAWNDEGVEAMPRFWVEDGEFEDPPELPDSSTYHGLGAVMERLRALNAVLPQSLLLEKLRPQGDDVVVLMRFQGSGSESGVPVDQPMGVVVSVTEGKISRMRTFLSHHDALEAVGLRE